MVAMAVRGGLLDLLALPDFSGDSMVAYGGGIWIDAAMELAVCAILLSTEAIILSIMRNWWSLSPMVVLAYAPGAVACAVTNQHAHKGH